MTRSSELQRVAEEMERNEARLDVWRRKLAALERAGGQGVKITLAAWNRRNFSPPISDHALRMLRRSGHIQPPPCKLGREWYVSAEAEVIADYDATASPAEDPDPVVAEILWGGRPGRRR